MLHMFGKRRSARMIKLVSKYMDQRVEQKKSFEEELGRLDDRLKKEKIDLTERDRLAFMLQTQFYEQQKKQWKHVQEKYVNPIIQSKSQYRILKI